MLNLAVLLDDSAREEPERTAIIYENTKMSYAELNVAANQVANGLVQAGIQRGDTVGLSCQDVANFPIVYYGILKAGAVVMPLNVLLKPREIAYHLQDADAKAYFCQEGSSELPIGEMGHTAFQEVDSCQHFYLIANNPDAPSPYVDAQTLSMLMRNQPTTFETAMTEPDDTAVILYTSGTTGKPKGAELSHLNMLMNARLSDTMYERRDHDVHLISLPLFHSFGQSVQLNAGIYNRATLVLLPRFHPDAALRLMDEENVTIFAGVPTMFWAILNYPQADKYDLQKIASNLRVCCSGGAAMPEKQTRKLLAIFCKSYLSACG